MCISHFQLCFSIDRSILGLGNKLVISPLRFLLSYKHGSNGSTHFFMRTPSFKTLIQTPCLLIMIVSRRFKNRQLEIFLQQEALKAYTGLPF